MRVFKHKNRSVFCTDLGTMRATWEVGHDGVPRILFVNDSTSSAPAFRWPDLPMPSCKAGHIAFEPGHRPALAEVIELLPQYENTLWEHVHMEFAAMNAARHAAGTPGCTIGRTFSASEQRQFDLQHGGVRFGEEPHQ